MDRHGNSFDSFNLLNRRSLAKQLNMICFLILSIENVMNFVSKFCTHPIIRTHSQSLESLYYLKNFRKYRNRISEM